MSAIFNIDALTTSTVMSFLNFREQAQLASLSKVTNELVSNDQKNKKINEV